ncbi:MAG: 3-deoxy-manno-octulosonate cytidylyltransferase [Pirellulaceae bacterium]|nr:3-deoxy-manno-octulosonate cytidylyltransferase [Pirellulaceae bacterium]
MEQCKIIIPARLNSTRLPRKLLLNETGKPLLQHTYESARESKLAGEVLIATDSQEIFEVATGFGAKVFMTSPTAPSGTDRISEVAAQFEETFCIVNVQGDEPELSGAEIDKAIELLLENPTAEMATLATPIYSREDLEDPSCVKVVFGESQQALYFSRSPIPYAREWNDSFLEQPHFYQHIGLYVYRRDFLLKFSEMSPTMAEKFERLEQLRVLEHGGTILVATTPKRSLGIDTEADYRAFVKKYNSC